MAPYTIRVINQIQIYCHTSITLFINTKSRLRHPTHLRQDIFIINTHQASNKYAYYDIPTYIITFTRCNPYLANNTLVGEGGWIKIKGSPVFPCLWPRHRWTMSLQSWGGGLVQWGCSVTVNWEAWALMKGLLCQIVLYKDGNMVTAEAFQISGYPPMQGGEGVLREWDQEAN